MPDVVLKTTLEGLREALQGLSQIDTALQSIGSRGGSAGPGMGTAGGAPATESVSPAGIGPSPAPPPPTQPPMPVPGAGAPAAPGVPKLGPGSTQPLQPMGFSQPMGGAMMVANLTITAQNVTLVGGGGTGGGGGGATGGTGSGGGMGPSGAQGGMPSPASMMGGSYQGFIQRAGQNLSPAGIAQAAMAEIPMLAGVLGVAGLAGGMAGGMWMAGTAPGYHTEMQMASAARMGQYISPEQASLMRIAAGMQGRLGAAQAGASVAESIPGLGGLVRWANEPVYRDLQAEAKAAEDRATIYPARAKLGTLTGQLELGDRFTTGDAELAWAESTRAFGRRARRLGNGFFPSGTVEEIQAQGWTPRDIGVAGGMVASMMLQPEQFAMRMVGSPKSMLTAVGDQLAGMADLRSLASLEPVTGNGLMSTWRQTAISNLNREGIATMRAGRQRALGEAGGTYAELFGGPETFMRSGQHGLNAITEEIGWRQSRIDNGSASGPYAVRLENELIGLRRQEMQVTQDLIRGFQSMNVVLATSTSGIASAQRSAAAITGIGGVAGFVYAQRDYEAKQGTLARKEMSLTQLRGMIEARGEDPERNPGYMRAREDYESTQTAVTAAGIDRANVPLSMPLQRQLSAQGYQLSVMQSLPGTYGNIRQTLQNQMGTLQGAAGEITARMEEQRRKNGGSLSDAEAFEYQKQLQNIGSQQAGVFGQLSYGWEGRLMSNAVNTPGSFSWASPMFAYRAAIGAGVKNPHMGSGSSDMPFFMRQAGLIGSIAGATGTPEGFGTTAMTGVAPNSNFAMPGGGVLNAPDLRGSIDGATIHIQMHMPDGSVQTMPGTLKTRSIQADVSPAGLAEASRGVSRMRY